MSAPRDASGEMLPPDTARGHLNNARYALALLLAEHYGQPMFSGTFRCTIEDMERIRQRLDAAERMLRTEQDQPEGAK